MAKTKNKRNTQAKCNDKLKALKDLYTCKVVLHNIALDKDLVQLYQLRFSEKTKEKVEHLSPYINTVRDSNNIQRLKKSIWEDNVKDKTSCLTRRSRKLTNKKNEECKNVEFLADISLHNKKIQPEFIAQKQQSKHGTKVELLSSKSSDETSNTSSSIYCSTRTKTVSISNEKHHSNKRPSVQKKNRLGCKKKIQLDISEIGTSVKISSDNTNYLDEENLTVTNCNSKMQEISSESIKKCEDNLLKVGVTNGTVCSIKLEQCEKNQNSKVVFPNIINKDVESKISKASETDSKSTNSDLFTVHTDINRTRKDARTKSNNKTTSLTTDSTIQATSVLLEKTFALDSSYPKIDVNKVPSDFLTTHNKKHANKKNIEGSTKKKLPKITGDCTLPKGTIKIMKANTSDKSLENSVSKKIVLKRKKYTNNSTKQVSCIDDTLGSTNIGEKKYHISEIDSSVNILKIPKSTPLNNNVNLNNKNIDNNKLYQTEIEHKSVKSLEIRNNIHNNTNDIKSVTTESYENCTLNQEQSNSSNNGEKQKNILQHNEKCYKINSDENILLKSTLNLVDVNESGNVNGLFISKEEAIKQKRKRIAEEDTVKLNNKKKKLNRTIYLQNIAAYAKSLNCQESVKNSEFPSISTTVKSNVSKENISGADLREHLNKKRSKSPKLSPLENKFKITKNSVEFEQTDLNNKNYTITPTNTTKKEKFRKKLFSEEEPTLNSISYKTKDVQTDSVSNDHMHCHSMLQSTLEETQHLSQIDRSCENTNVQEKHMNIRNEDDDDDYISLFAESFDTNLCESTIFNERDKPSKSPQSDAPYIMTTSSFNKYMKQNATEFNKEYAKYAEDSVKMSNETLKTEREFNNQSRQTIHTDCVLQTRTPKVITLETKNMEVTNWLERRNFMNFINGYCYMILRKGFCLKQSQCKFKHELQPLVNAILSEDSRMILDMVQNAMRNGYNYFSGLIYTKSLQKLTIDNILTTYRMFHHIHIQTEMTFHLKKYIVQMIIIELSNRQLSLKTIVNYFLEYFNDLRNLEVILSCIERYIKPGEYWNTVKNLVLRLPLDKFIMEKILSDCIKNEDLIDIEDINNNLISKASPIVISRLDKNVLERFKSLLAEKTVNDSHPVVLVQNFGERASETIASPDGSTSLSQTDSLKRDNTFINKSANKIESHSTEVNGESYNKYIIRPIDDLPDARSAYRNHEHLWKFFVDLDGFKKGLEHNDYDYVINILKKYTEKQDENSLFIRSCCNILRTEVKRSEYHLKNIIRRTVQMGTFDILGKILFEIGLDVLTSLMDNEAWGLALYLIQSLNIHDLPYNAEYFLLSAEIYLANKKALKACDLLKSKNIICTSRDKWYVESTIIDERVRKELMYILLDSFCNEFVEHAFFLFQFLLKDQCSQYYPIDLSRYVDKLIMLSLSKKDTSFIIEMANLVLKYTFALNTTTCRALISTLIHIDENLARQIYNYAQGLGIYPAVKLWPVTYIIINTNLTEEEIYLTFLQLLKNLIINFGHTIEFAKSQIKVYLILEINSIDEQFYCTELHYNNRAITNIKELIRKVLKNRFDPPISLMSGSKGRIYKLQSKSVINYLKTEHCN